MSLSRRCRVFLLSAVSFLKGNSQVNGAQDCSRAGPRVLLSDVLWGGGRFLFVRFCVSSLSVFYSWQSQQSLEPCSLQFTTILPENLQETGRCVMPLSLEKYSRSSRRWKKISLKWQHPMLIPLLVFTIVPHLFPLQIKITPKLYDACRFLISTRKDHTWRTVK